MVPMISLLYARSCAMLMTELLPDKGSFVSWLKEWRQEPGKRAKARGKLRPILVWPYERNSSDSNEPTATENTRTVLVTRKLSRRDSHRRWPQARAGVSLPPRITFIKHFRRAGLPHIRD